MSMNEKLSSICKRHEELAALMAGGDLSGDEFTKYSVEYADLSPIVEAITEHEQAIEERDELQEFLKDPEMKSMAQDDLVRLDKRIPELEKQIRLALILKIS